MGIAIRGILLAVIAVLLPAAAPGWNAAPWLADLQQFRAAIETDYPNLEWLETQREVALDPWFARAAADIRASRDDAAARRALDRLVERFDDGHLALRWPSPPEDGSNVPIPAAPRGPMTVARFCAAQGYDAGQVTIGTAASLPGYRSISTGGPFAAGLVRVDRKTVGIVRLGVFAPQGYPILCEHAVARLRIPVDQPCDATCSDRLLTEAFALMTQAFMATTERLAAEGADVLLVDVTRNGGGTEWAEAAARIVAPVPLRSAPIRVIRGKAWVSQWRALATKLRRQADTAPPDERSMVLSFARQADQTADDLGPCMKAPCARLAQAGFASGLLPELPAGKLNGISWGPEVFSAAQFPYRDSVWKGPVIVLVDDETWSAAEEFAALLRDNDAAIVMGTRTGGAGCGHIGGDPAITLRYSGAKLEMPNCARFRRDGSNEVSGVVPDVSTGVRWNDGPAFAGRMTARHLPDAIARAQALRGTVR